MSMSVHGITSGGGDTLLGEVPAGVKTSKMDQRGNFLNIPRRGQGEMNLSARRDHDILSTTAQAIEAQNLNLNSDRLNQSMHAGFP